MKFFDCSESITREVFQIVVISTCVVYQEGQFQAADL